ncbi:MAG: HEAT repeat domain-containing protein [Lentisphaeraceae bacterium]|nr:HEAT repeat domain-containing protein [Lentisphaeraceae bacterium]
MNLRMTALKSLAAISFVALTSCSTYVPDESLTKEVHVWGKGKDDSAARVALRNATHRASTDEVLREKHEADLIFALKKSKDTSSQIFFVHELKLIGQDDALEALSTFIKNDAVGPHAVMAMQYIHTAGFDAETVLNEALPTSQGKTKVAVVKALGSIRSSDSLETLEVLMTSQDKVLRYAAIRSVANIGDSDSAEKLMTQISKEKGFWRNKVITWNFLYARNLAESDEDDAADHCLGILSKLDKNKDVHLYVNGLSSLAEIRGDSFTGDLIEDLQDSNDRVAEGVSRLLEHSTDTSVNSKLIQLFTKAKPYTQELILKVVLNRGDKDASNLVAQSLKSSDEGVRTQAARLSIEVSASLVVPGLLDLVLNGTTKDQSEAVKALSRIPTDQSSASIRKVYLSANDSAKIKLLAILAGKSDSANADLVLAATLDADKKVSKAAFSALKGIAEERQVPQLLTMVAKASSSSQMRGYQAALVTASLSNVDAVADQVVKAVNMNASAKSNLALIQVLSRLGGNAAFKGLQSFYEKGSPVVQKEAMRSLAKWSSINDVEALLKMTSSLAVSERTLMTRGLSSLIGNSLLSIDEKKDLLNRTAALADDSEKARIKGLVAKLK